MTKMILELPMIEEHLHPGLSFKTSVLILNLPQRVRLRLGLNDWVKFRHRHNRVPTLLPTFVISFSDTSSTSNDSLLKALPNLVHYV